MGKNTQKIEQYILSLKLTAKTPENRPNPKRKIIIFQPLIFRGELLVSGRVESFPSPFSFHGKRSCSKYVRILVHPTEKTFIQPTGDRDRDIVTMSFPCFFSASRIHMNHGISSYWIGGHLPYFEQLTPWKINDWNPQNIEGW